MSKPKKSQEVAGIAISPTEMAEIRLLARKKGLTVSKLLGAMLLPIVRQELARLERAL